MGWGTLIPLAIGAATAGVGAIASGVANRNQNRIAAQEAQQQNQLSNQAMMQNSAQQNFVQQQQLAMQNMVNQRQTALDAQLGPQVTNPTALSGMAAVATSGAAGDTSTPLTARSRLLGN